MEQLSQKFKVRRCGRKQQETVPSLTSRSRYLHSSATCTVTTCIHATVSRHNAQICAGPCQCSSSPFRFKRPRPELRTGRGDVFAHSLNEGGYHSWRHLDACTTRSDERTSSCSGKPDGSRNTAGGSPTLKASAKCIRDRSC